MKSRSINKPGRTPLRAALLAGATALALATGTGTALATTIGTSSDFTVTFLKTLTTSPQPLEGGRATAQFSNFNFSSSTGSSTNDQVTFQIIASNTSFGTGSNNLIRLTSFGWDTLPTATATSNTSSVYMSTTSANISGGTTVDVCLYGGRNCTGGANGGLYDPQNAQVTTTINHPSTDTFDVTLTFGNSLPTGVPPLTFSNFDAKFQSTNFSSFDVVGTVKPNNPQSVPSVPEPGSLALLGSGLIGLGLVMRRRRRS